MRSNPSARRRAACAALAAAGLAVLPACSSLQPAGLANPAPLHGSNPAGKHPGYKPTPAEEKADETAAGAADILRSRYHKAMADAQADGAAQAKIDLYMAEGVALIELHCLRWFGKLEDAQRNLQVSDTNRNVITQLGTTAIGLAKLRPAVTAAYGAVNTTVTGFNANFASAFLAAPNAENVKRLTLEAISNRAAQLRKPDSTHYPKSFSSAYLQLEKLAAQCTFAEVKQLTTKSVDAANAEPDAKTGETIVFSRATAQQATLRNEVGTTLERIDALSPADALTLARIMPSRKEPVVVSLLAASDPQARRLTDDTVARAILKRVFVLTAKTEAALVTWDARLRAVTE